MPEPLTRITDVLMKCPLCGTVTRAGDCEPDVDGDGGLGCPVSECGGLVAEVVEQANQAKAF